MKLYRFNDDRLGLLEGDQLCDVTSALDTLPSYRYPAPRGDQLIAHLDALKPRIMEAAKSAKRTPVAGAKLLPVVANAGKVVAAPVNYKAHLDEASVDPEIHHNKKVIEIQNIGLFLKATSSIIGASDTVELHHLDRRNDHEIELVAIIGKTAKNVKLANALEYIAGYCIGLDMTVRGAEERSLRKSIDTFTVLGPCLVTADEIGDPSGLQMVLTVNGEPRQNANTRDLLIDVPHLIEWATSFYTLHPGDVLMTGTPEGVGRVQPGDVIDARIDKLGAMQVKVGAAER